VDLDASFRAVEAALALETPPLMHTPQSLMRMLLDVFELEFPDTLPRAAAAQLILAIGSAGVQGGCPQNAPDPRGQ
jgi:hypothetical protein